MAAHAPAQRVAALALLALLAAAAPLGAAANSDPYVFDPQEPLCAGWDCVHSELPPNKPGAKWERVPVTESLEEGAPHAAANATIIAIDGVKESEYFTWKPKYEGGKKVVDVTRVQPPTCAWRVPAAKGGMNYYAVVTTKTWEWTRDEAHQLFEDTDGWAGWVHVPDDYATGGQIWGRARKLWDGTDAAACWLGPTKFTYTSHGGINVTGGALGAEYSTLDPPLGTNWSPPDGSKAYWKHPPPRVPAPPAGPGGAAAPGGAGAPGGANAPAADGLPPNRVEMRLMLDGDVDVKTWTTLLAVAVGLPPSAITEVPAPAGRRLLAAGARRLLVAIPLHLIVAVPDGADPEAVVAKLKKALADKANAVDLAGATNVEYRAYSGGVALGPAPAPPAPPSSGGGGLSTGVLVGCVVGGVVAVAAAAAVLVVVVKRRQAAAAAAPARAPSMGAAADVSFARAGSAKA